MRVWVMSNEFAPHVIGGLGVVATHLTNSFARHNLNVTVISNTNENEIKEDQKNTVTILRFPKKTDQVNRSRYISNWLQENRYHRPHIIHVHSVNFMSLAKLYKEKYGVPVIYTCHSLVIFERAGELRKLMAARQEMLMQVADAIISPSHWQKEKIEKTYPQFAKKVIVIANGINVNKQPFPSPVTKLLYVGRITRMKGIEELLQAVALLSKSQPDVQLDIVGKGTNRYVNKIKNFASQLGIASKVGWLGYYEPDKVSQLYPRYGAVIVPSKRESFGLVAMEALANGVPLVSTASGGLSEFVDDSVAEVIPSVTSASIAKAVENMWNQQELTSLRIMNGLKKASHYDWKSITERYLDVFSRYVKDKKKAVRREYFDWTLKKAWKAKRQGQVWIVENGKGQKGYFKFATKEQWYYSGPMVANEYIAASLAKRLGFPVAALEVATVYGPDGERQKGIVSRVVEAKEVVTWKKAGAQVHAFPEKHVDQLDLLRQLVVFDAWIANIDRANGKNLILYRNEPNEKYRWYLIDHGHSLYGSPRKWKRGNWNQPIWSKLWMYYHVPKGLLRLQSSMDKLEPMIRAIESLKESGIDDAIRSVPKGYLGAEEQAFIKRLLLDRQKKLRSIMGDWLKYDGIKEYAGA